MALGWGPFHSVLRLADGCPLAALPLRKLAEQEGAMVGFGSTCSKWGVSHWKGGCSGSSREPHGGCCRWDSEV